MKNKICLFLGSVTVALTILLILLGIQLRQTVAGTMISARQVENLKSEFELIFCGGAEHFACFEVALGELRLVGRIGVELSFEAEACVFDEGESSLADD